MTRRRALPAAALVRTLVLLTALGGTVCVPLAAQAPVSGASPAWNPSPAAAEASARSLGKPVLLLWQAGPGAPSFTQAAEQLFTAWPLWSAQAQLAAVFTRGRSWEAPLPPGFPVLADPKSSALALWVPGSGEEPTVWTQVPPVLELSRALARASGRPLDDPYSLDAAAFVWDGGTLVRRDGGPLWDGTGPGGPTEWTEEGPLGTVLILREVPAGRRAAFPLEGDWSFLYDPETQGWNPWNPVLVKRP